MNRDTYTAINVLARQSRGSRVVFTGYGASSTRTRIKVFFSDLA